VRPNFQKEDASRLGPKATSQLGLGRTPFPFGNRLRPRPRGALILPIVRRSRPSALHAADREEQDTEPKT
jgi:hypothetical protein